MNILILSAGTRNKIIQYFKKSLGDDSIIHVGDCSELAPALYEGDRIFITPRLTDSNYLNTILRYCEKNKVDAILSLIDPELSILAENIDRFLEIGTLPVVSSYETVELCFDKFEFHNRLIENNIPTPRTYKDLESLTKSIQNKSIDFPIFVKPRKGSASLHISKIHSMKELEILLDDNLIFQEFINGKEYGIDCYFDLISGELVSVFMKEKIKMRAGETDKSKSVWIPEILQLIKQLEKIMDLKGPIDIDIFEKKGQFMVSEINPRFGGGYPHAYECDVDFIGLIKTNISKSENIVYDILQEYEQDIYMMKHNEVTIKKEIKDGSSSNIHQ